MKKRVFVWLVMALLLIGTGTVSATELGSGLKEPEVIAVPERKVSEDVVNPEQVTEAQDADEQMDKWDIYSSKYYYNQLEDDYKKVWDALDVVCKSYFDVTKDAAITNGYTDSISLPAGTTLDELKLFWRLYTFSNPQYYFLSNGYSYTYAQGDEEKKPKSVKLGIYQAFYNGEDRAIATAKVESQLAAWQEQIDACSTDVEKIKTIQDLICAKVTYNKDAANNKVDEQVSFSQSPYSVLCGDSTVCAGYSDTFYMLCNAAEIDAISVTSPGHQWNKARINGSWYNFDPTWDDTYTESRGYLVYRYHGRSDEMYDVDMNSGMVSNIEGHQEEAFWDGYIPSCNLDTNPAGNCKTPGTFAEANGQVATPIINFTYDSSVIKANLSCETTGASIYYTTDGTKPAVAGTKSIKYTGAFTVEENACIKAVAVKDSYMDSVIAESMAKLEKYTITYQLDGGINASENPETYNACDEIVLQVPSKQGYVFAGWYLDEHRTAEVTGIAIGSTGVRTFYAKWEPIIYKIAFDGNGASDGEMMIRSECRYDAFVTLLENNYTRIGYTFTGWNTKADGSGKSYEDMASVKNLAAEEDATATLYAQWTPVLYTIYFDGNGAENGEMNAVADCKYSEKVTLPANVYTRSGYVFVEWNTEADGSGKTYEAGDTIKKLPETDGEEIILYAQWKPISYVVSFDGNGATGGETETLICNYDGSYEISANGYEKSGYSFNGWNSKADGTGIDYAQGVSFKNLSATNGATITLYAQWKTNSYTIKFDGNKAGKGSMESMPSLLYGKSYKLASNKYKRTGYRFAGWNTAKNGKGIALKNMATVQNLSSQDGGVVTLYAQWNANKYTVKFHGNGATSGSMKKMKNRTYDKKFRLSANKFKREGYKFVGWNTKKNGKGKMYKNKAKVKNLTSKNGKTVTLYAQWKKI